MIFAYRLNQKFTLKCFSIGVWNFIKNNFLIIYSFLVYFHLSVLINNQQLSTLIVVFCRLLQGEVILKLTSGTFNINVALERNLSLSYVWTWLNHITSPQSPSLDIRA